MDIKENSRHLLTISARRGLCLYNCLSFGIEVIPAISKQMDMMLAGLDIWLIYLDIVPRSVIRSEHYGYLAKMFKHIQMWLYRQILRILWSEHVSNKEVRKKVRN